MAWIEYQFSMWKKVRDGTLARAAFVATVTPIRKTIDALLLRGWQFAEQRIDLLRCSGRLARRRQVVEDVG